MFETGQWVVYGVHGVCRVVGRETQMVNRKRMEYLVLEPMENSESKYLIPMDNALAMGKLHPVLPAKELKALLVSEEIRAHHWIDNETQRKQHYRELICAGDRISLLRMTAALYRCKAAKQVTGRKFHLCDDSFLRDAEKLLAQEVSLVLEMSAEEARDYLRQVLSQ